MAEVYRATDVVLDRPVALKVLRDVNSSEDERARFTAEAKVLARLNHPGLVTVLDAGTAGDQPFLVMDLVDGPTLAEKVAGTPMQTAEIADIGGQVARALAYVHSSGVVHRDVKPGNVLLGPDGRARLADFGIARLVDHGAQLTRTGHALGSPTYFSPEQVRSQRVGPPSDIYSLGLVLLEALTGRIAFPGQPMQSALTRLSNPVPIPDDLPPAWRRLLGAMTATDPRDRPDAKQAAQTLEEGGLDEPATPSAGDENSSHTRLMVIPEAERQPRRVTKAQAAGWAATAQDSGRRLMTKGREQVSALRPPPRPVLLGIGGAALLIAVILAFSLGAGSGGSPAKPRPSDLPSGVPSHLKQPLQGLHDSLDGKSS
jgi:serine/threonine protein kinase